jgi:UDP-N-acetylglucosamine diphosphorylase/glucosamine-1-phosphate N-acetyltransferase
MNYILFDEPEVRERLLPFTLTRPVCDIRVGILTIREKWEYELKQGVLVKTEEYLSKKHSYKVSSKEEKTWINASVLPHRAIAKSIMLLRAKEALWYKNMLIAYRGELNNIKIDWRGEDISKLEHIWDIFTLNGREIEADFNRLARGKKNTLSETNTLIGKNIFAEKGAKALCAILNSEAGPIYIGKNAEIMEGAVIKGPVAICEGAVIKAGAKIYGDTTIGPYCKVGGEVSNSVIFGYSNKAHDGFIGNSVIGEWCNLGAGTNTSNLKNNYSIVSVYDYRKKKQIATGLTFCGLMMGDHSKCSINTMFNTGTITGVCANIFGAGFPPKYIPSFSWGGASGFELYDFSKAMETAEKVFERRHKKLDNIELGILKKVFEMNKLE